MDDNVITIRVLGDPGPQGSKSFKGISKKGHAILVESSKKVAPWREDVRQAAMRELDRLGIVGGIKGPVFVDMIFSLIRPKAAKKRKYPHVPPDLDKLARSTGDSLKSAGAFEDDSRIVAYGRLAKVYAGSTDQDALPSPGCLIRLRAA